MLRREFMTALATAPFLGDEELERFKKQVKLKLQNLGFRKLERFEGDMEFAINICKKHKVENPKIFIWEFIMFLYDADSVDSFSLRFATC